ncbi:MAG: TetR/AcrR family transcriptional regulator [Pseudodonghicola sp.]|nr:TetR/AcrR family transcriptional regulator [Pseudodonghicola sp.]
MQAAAICFMRHGLEKATMHDVARELNATKGRVYHHFRSRNEIILPSTARPCSSVSTLCGPFWPKPCRQTSHCCAWRQPTAM